MRNQEDLLALARRYATDRRAPVATITKEILHYEILHALQESGALGYLTFQGGTSLRLCYQGNRYSEDLDFAGGRAFDPAVMTSFCDLLRREIADAYGLVVTVNEPEVGAHDGNAAVKVSRWSARIAVPNADRSAPQRELIKIEVANVPAYDPDLVPVAINYPHLPVPISQMLIPVESRDEILGDKIVALGARPYFKARDVWDIKFLLDKGVAESNGLKYVGRKLGDYGLPIDAFKASLAERIQELGRADTAERFRKEMIRFVDATVAHYLEGPAFVAKWMERSIRLAEQVIAADLERFD
ncbi:nucleotidyl transferase AbiEii/AbiGii toxin family protein [Pararobbsia silviterrae]|uniref:Nucleotidyl transferase AbiEii/AbiGii toxin family protein n=1 Tax=Pararobbsia silviterrae TaxID=1792498 RepID=A0A494XRV8_9BURK|nr:nucleotidyl transferase AbiEii/AbiGii toxin family protein [Pararobbsia silviterrae]RKP53368.1 nucleotidyl transferase AbiEii/AbiGii toxin family protein [Pararobbsia silviterrae]